MGRFIPQVRSTRCKKGDRVIDRTALGRAAQMLCLYRPHRIERDGSSVVFAVTGDHGDRGSVRRLVFDSTRLRRGFGRDFLVFLTERRLSGGKFARDAAPDNGGPSAFRTSTASPIHARRMEHEAA